MKIFISSDHTAIDLRKHIINHLELKGHTVIDFGTNLEKDNYAVLGLKVATNVADTVDSFGIVLCSTGIGISIAANKVNGIRAALVDDIRLAKLSREHNDANILAMGSSCIDSDEALKIVDTFLETKFEGGRHIERIKIISDYSENNK